MAIGIDDLYDDDYESTQEEQQINNQEPATNQQQQVLDNNSSDDDFISDYLKSKGIDDPSKIMFEDDNNQLIERSWNDLSKEEKFNILNTPLTQETKDNNNNDDLSDEEIELLNQIRTSNLTPSQYIQQLQGQQITQEPQYKIDDLSDDELYLLDLESRVGELSDDDAAQALSIAKQNEDLYKKQIEGIRKEYKEREDLQAKQEEAEREQEQQDAYNKFQESVVNSISQFNSIGNLDLNFDDSDKEELAQFMLDKDESGNNYLWQALQDPDNLVKAAWFILNGDEAMNNISDYFVKQIKLVSENQYKKGFEEGRSGAQPTKPQIIIRQSKNNNNTNLHKSIKDINDLYDED